MIPWPLCCLLAEPDFAVQVTLAGLHETFSDAKDIMKWLGTCAKVIASRNEAVQWSTPLGLPVVQPYRQMVSGGRCQAMVTGSVWGKCRLGCGDSVNWPEPLMQMRCFEDSDDWPEPLV